MAVASAESMPTWDVLTRRCWLKRGITNIYRLIIGQPSKDNHLLTWSCHCRAYKANVKCYKGATFSSPWSRLILWLLMKYCRHIAVTDPRPMIISAVVEHKAIWESVRRDRYFGCGVRYDAVIAHQMPNKPAAGSKWNLQRTRKYLGLISFIARNMRVVLRHHVDIVHFRAMPFTKCDDKGVWVSMSDESSIVFVKWHCHRMPTLIKKARLFIE